MRKKANKDKSKAYNPQYCEKKTFFSDKEIIFRSQKRAKVITISSKAQLIFWCALLFISVWSFYSYHIYNKSGAMISVKNQELESTRDAYVDLMGDFMSLQKNIATMLSSLGSKAPKPDIEKYKRQALAVEDKIKQMNSERDWASDEKIEEKISLSEAVLQRDIASSERDELKKQMNAMEDIVEELKEAEMEVLERVSKISSREVGKIKGAFTDINVPIKKNGLYFNALANSKKNSKGGLFVPAPKTKIKDKAFRDKVTQIFNDVNDLEYYREVAQYVPLGKPVWSYWVTSQYGGRSDPFNKKLARHKGVDLSSRTGNKITIQAKGRVITAKYSGGYGNLVVVDHGNGFVTKYAHMNKIYVKKGAYLDIGDTVGEVGTTGRSTGPHLHYEVIYRGKNIDPIPFIKAKIS